MGYSLLHLSSKTSMLHDPNPSVSAHAAGFCWIAEIHARTCLSTISDTPIDASGFVRDYDSAALQRGIVFRAR